MITIDNIRLEDADRLYALFGDWDPDYSFDRAVFDESLGRCLGREENFILAARDGDRLVGYLQMFPVHELGFGPWFNVEELLVAKSERNKGIGRLLMARAEEIALSCGIHEIKLCSQVHRSRAHVFYENLGYTFYKISKFYEKAFRAP